MVDASCEDGSVTRASKEFKEFLQAVILSEAEGRVEGSLAFKLLLQGIPPLSHFVRSVGMTG